MIERKTVSQCISSDFSIDEKLYLEAKKYCRKCKPEMRGNLFYALLDWCYQHQEILESIARREDTYDILYINKDGFSHKESFSGHSEGNPHRLARQRFSELIAEGVQVAELRHRPNPYISGPERDGSLILSYGKE